jgi:uncharacterized protein YbjT (DUF2867 family)
MTMKLVAGATGNAGGAVVRALVERGERVRAVVREGRAGAFDAGDVEVVTADLDDTATLVPHLAGIDGAFLLSGYDSTAGLLEAATGAGLDHVVLLSAASAGSTARDDNAIAAYHRESERLVEASGLAWTVLRPVSFMSNTFRWRDSILAGQPVLEPFPAAASAVIDPADIGSVAAVALLDRSQDRQVLSLTGPESLLPTQRIAILGEALGRRIELVEIPPDDAPEHLASTMPAKYADAFVEFFLEGTLDESPVLPTVRTVTGREPTGYASWVAANIDRFRS